jgi:hypothetical protein
MQLPEDIAAFDVPDTEKAAAIPVLRKLQREYPLPFAAEWSVSDVGEWLDHKGYGALKKSFAKRKLVSLLCFLSSVGFQLLLAPLGWSYPVQSNNHPAGLDGGSRQLSSSAVARCERAEGVAQPQPSGCCQLERARGGSMAEDRGVGPLGACTPSTQGTIPCVVGAGMRVHILV